MMVADLTTSASVLSLISRYLGSRCLRSAILLAQVMRVSKRGGKRALGRDSPHGPLIKPGAQVGEPSVQMEARDRTSAAAGSRPLQLASSRPAILGRAYRRPFRGKCLDYGILELTENKLTRSFILIAT